VQVPGLVTTASPFARQVEGGSRGTARSGATPGFSAAPLPAKGFRFDSSRPLEPRADAWSGRGDRWSGSSTPSRVTGAPPPAAFDGERRRPNRRSACGVTGRSRVCSIFTSVAEVHERYLARSRSSWSWPRRNEGPSASEETRLGRTTLTHGWKALWVVELRHRSCGPEGSDPKRSVRGKPVRGPSRRKIPPHSRTRAIQSE
jgi:hypothetical protein